MSDNLENRGPKDRTRISLHEDWEMSYWCKELKCSDAELQAAVKQVGNSVDAVREVISSKP